MKLYAAVLALVVVSVPALAQDKGSADALYEQALALEREGKGAEAVKLYTQAARSGNENAAKRLREIFQSLGGMPRKPLIGDFSTKLEQERNTGSSPK